MMSDRFIPTVSTSFVVEAVGKKLRDDLKRELMVIAESVVDEVVQSTLDSVQLEGAAFLNAEKLGPEITISITDARKGRE